MRVLARLAAAFSPAAERCLPPPPTVRPYCSGHNCNLKIDLSRGPRVGVPATPVAGCGDLPGLRHLAHTADSRSAAESAALRAGIQRCNSVSPVARLTNEEHDAATIAATKKLTEWDFHDFPAHRSCAGVDKR